MSFIERYENKQEIFFGLDLNEEQKEMVTEIMDGNSIVVMCNAVAGAGKTLIAIACAKILALSPEYDFDGATYIFPTVEEGVLGYKPGSIEDKERSYLSPLYDALEAVGDFPPKSIKSDENKSGQAWIRAQSGTFMRGSNIEKKVLIIDEAQNMTIPQLKKIISRAHDNCKVIILGCTEQIDIDPRHSGFSSLLRFLGQYKDKVKVCELKKSYRGWLAQTINNF